MAGFNPELSYRDNLELARALLIGKGAGDCAMRGSVFNPDTGARFSAAYRINAWHPQLEIAQLTLPPPGGTSLYPLARISVDPEDMPMIAVSRHTVHGFDPCRELDEILAAEDLPPLRSGTAHCPIAFDIVIDNIFSFLPDTTQ